ncbi:aldo/keto reductase [Parablautia intestinalis]|uniref:aldo/keto reductase n=1 Tax=Parablautia intestinalis TaxID=2320100 RepID=UPI00256EDC2E|nr:aldo/keto reductase [Parablautia intestinalis]
MERLSFDSTVILRNGVKMPRLGYGSAEIAPTVVEQTKIIRDAIDVGYRLIDTASIYHTERAVGQAVKESGICRDEFFISTKIWNNNARKGRKEIIKDFEESLRRLQTDYVDLLFVHWPVQGKLLETWEVMQDIYYAGKARALGLTNVKRHHYLDIMQNCDLYPHVQQDSYNPICRNLYEKIFCENHDIQYEAFLPIIRGRVNQMPELKQIADNHNKSVIQIVLRWDLQSGVCTIPRTANKEHMVSNADIFDFELSDKEMEIINGMNREEETNWDTENFNF